jgi:4a-hydroxytetrahydrobiopterin dehydratase
MSNPLSISELTKLLDDLNGWSHQNDSIKKTFEFKNFKQAFAFMVKVAFEAEELAHHPDWSNVYKTVHISLSTHDAGNKVTLKDIELAKRIDELAI